MSRNKRKSRKDDRPQWLVELATKHGIFIVQDDLGTVDFIDTTTGKSLGIWRLRPWPQYVIKGMARNGTVRDALQAIVAPYDL